MADLPEPIQRFDTAQRNTLALARAVVADLRAGMKAADVVALSHKHAPAFGFKGWFHAPVAQIGPWIGRHPEAARWLGRSATLEAGTLVSLDLGPAMGEAYGDLGITVSLPGAPVPEVIAAGRECLQAACGYASRWKTMGEILIFSEAWAMNRSMKLDNSKSIGHRIVGKEGWYATAFPRSALLATRWGPNQLHRLNPRRLDGIFAINPALRIGEQVASFEEMVYIHKETHRILGRDHLHEVGTL